MFGGDFPYEASWYIIYSVMEDDKKTADGSESKKSALENLREKLYIKEAKLPKWRRVRFRPHETRGTDVWTEEQEPVISLSREEKRALFVKRFFFLSFIFFALALGVFFFVFLGGTNIVSTEKVEILINAPVSVEAGKELAIEIVVQNKNDVPLESADLLVEYPEGTQDPLNLETPLLRSRKTIGAISEGGAQTTVEHIVLFGQEGDEKEIRVTVEYRLEDSNAIFVADKTYTLNISSSPIRISVDSLKEVNSGKEFEMSVHVISNSNQTLNNLLLHIDYPFGYSPVEGVPKAAYGNDTWKIGDLTPGSTRDIVVRGIIQGQDGEEKTIRIESGVPSSLDERSIGVAYARFYQRIVVARPFFDVRLLLDGNSDKEYVVEGNQVIRAKIEWVNNLPTRIVDVSFEARLSGTALNQESVAADNGFYRSFDNTIVWDAGTFSELSEIPAGERGGVTFSFAPLSLLQGAGISLRNPEIRIEVDVSAKRLSETGVPQSIQSSVASLVKVNSDVAVAQQAVYSIGPFTNTGPLPPHVAEETTYTILWTVVNSANTITGSVVTATLPPAVRWVGATSPASEEISYNASGRVVRWSLGTIRPGAGISLPPKEVAFQVALLPSITDRDKISTLSSPAEFTGIDQFTLKELKSVSREATTELNTDPAYARGYDIVQ